MIVIIILILLLLMLSAIFSATETAYSTMNVFRIKQMAKSSKNNKKAKVAYELSLNYSSLLSTILVSNNMVNMALASISSYFCSSALNLGATGVVYSTLISSILVIIFGEIMPKTLAKIWPESFALIIARPINIVVKILKPITYWFTKFDEKITEYADEDEERVTATEKELVEIVETVEREGVLEHNESELIKNAINFDEITVRTVMQDKERVVTIGLDDDFEDVVKVCLEQNYSRFPVIDANGKIVGIILQNDILKSSMDGQVSSVRKLLNEPVYISYRRTLPVALNLMQRDKSHMAIVIDNKKEKNYMGIVTMEDVLEELVGEIYDEYDDIPADIVEIGNDAFEVSGKVTIEDFFDNYLDEVTEPKTKQLYIGPWVKELLGDADIDSEIYYENLKILVLEHENNKIVKVSIEVISAFDEKI